MSAQGGHPHRRCGGRRETTGRGTGGCAGSCSRQEFTPRTCLQVPTDAYRPVIANLTEERRNFQNPGVVLNYLQNMSLSLPDKALSPDTARNLTEVRPSRARPQGRGATADGCGCSTCSDPKNPGALT